MANDFKLSAEKVLDHLKNSVCSGDVVVFHDSQKAGKLRWRFCRNLLSIAGHLLAN